MRKFTDREFISESRQVWGDRWEYPRTKYQGMRKAVVVTCATHGDFEQTASSLLKGFVGCSGCDGRRRTGNSADFISRASEVWGDRWDYSKVQYKDFKTKVTIICREHGEFHQTPRRHYDGRVGCLDCRGELHDTASFLRRAHEVWGAERWGYSLTKYDRSTIPVVIHCFSHGDFEQEPRHHLNGNVGCAQCRTEEALLPLEDLLARSKAVWGDRWDYTQSKYAGISEKMSITCPAHGHFKQSPYNHLKGYVGCRECQDPGNLTTEEFIRRSQEAWGSNRWDYTKTQYTRQLEKVTLTCPEHGDFNQFPDAHLRGGVGCSKCSWSRTSRGEKQLYEFVLSLGVRAEENVRGLVSNNPRLEVDVWVPEQRVALEYNGVYYHSEKFKSHKAHAEKMQALADEGIRLIQIWEDDWNSRQEILREHIRQVLGVSQLPKVNARELHIREIGTQEARQFLEEYHLQGFVGSSIYLGAFTSEDALVAVASFKRAGEGYYLTRYATSCLVRGGHSKMVSHFERHYDYQTLITFADLATSAGDLYRKTGWVEGSLLEPDYKYVHGNVRHHKFKYRLDRFKRDPQLRYVEGMTEGELAKLNGLLRVYDAGKIRFTKKKERRHVQ